jgi:hypothetical protein
MHGHWKKKEIQPAKGDHFLRLNIIFVTPPTICPKAGRKKNRNKQCILSNDDNNSSSDNSLGLV